MLEKPICFCAIQMTGDYTTCSPSYYSALPIRCLIVDSFLLRFVDFFDTTIGVELGTREVLVDDTRIKLQVRAAP